MKSETRLLLFQQPIWARANEALGKRVSILYSSGMKTLFLILPMAISLASAAMAQPAERLVIKLWPEGAPGALGTADKDIPTLTVYLPTAEKRTGAAMVICPGGGYTGLAAHEGEGYALWLAENGIASFVLKYRLGSSGYRHPRMLEDAARAVRLVRARAADWNVDAARVGIMGSSAGGHLASTLLTHFDAGNTNAPDPIDRQSSRPDLGILCYPVITLGQYTHQGSKNSLLGRNPPEDLVASLSNELQVTKDTPPCFVWHTYEDTTVPVENSLQFAAALRKARVPFELHIYEKGGHGMGLKGDAAHHHQWADDCLAWLKVRKFAN